MTGFACDNYAVFQLQLGLETVKKIEKYSEK